MAFIGGTRGAGLYAAGPAVTGGFASRRAGALVLGGAGPPVGVGGTYGAGPIGGIAGPVGGGTGYLGGGYGGYGYGGGGGYGFGTGPTCCGVACGDGTGCGEGGVGCGTGTGGSILTYVGAGGDYVQETTYRYVGGGAGTFGLVPVGSPPNFCLWIIPAGLCLLLLPLLLYLLFSSASGNPSPVVPTTQPIIPPTEPVVPLPGTTTDTPQGPTGTCIVRGDPHVTTFDGRHISFYSQGEYWVVKSAYIYIQARYMPTPVTHGLSATKEVAIGGPFLNNKILRVSALAASFDGVPILTTFPSQFTNADPPIIAQYNAEGEVLQQGRQGKPLQAVHLGLPKGVYLQINRWNEPGEGDYINVKITMPQQPMQDGHCGNFNGNIEDDRRLAIRARIGANGVDPSQLLFNTKTPVTAPQRPDLNNCPEEKANHARDVCKSVSKNNIPSHDCMIDVCYGGDQFAYEGDYEE